MTRYAFKVGEHPSLDVRVAVGRLDIAASPNGEVVVEISGSGAEFVTVEQVGDTTYIREERRLFGGRSVNIRAAVPDGSNLEAGAASLGIVARVELGRVQARTASGDLDFGPVASIEAKSSSGDIKVGSCAGRCEVGSASGDVRIQRVVGDLTVSTASGDISVERADGRVEAKTASGDVRVGVCTGAAVEVSSMSGDVDLGLVAGTRIEAEIDSLSGDVTLPPRRPPGGQSERSLRLRAKTVSGDVIVRRITL